MTEVLSWASASQWGKMAQKGPSGWQTLQIAAEGLVPSGHCLEFQDRGCCLVMKDHSKVTSWGNIVTFTETFIANVQSETESLNRKRKSHWGSAGLCVDSNDNRNSAQWHPPHGSNKSKQELRSSVNSFSYTYKRKEPDTLRTLFLENISFSKCALGSWPPLVQCLFHCDSFERWS